MKAILAEKKEMTHVFREDGQVVPVTALLATPNIVTQVKSEDKDGYNAVQLGFGEKKNHNKPLKGHLKKSGAKSKKLMEVRVNKVDSYKVGDKITVDIFEEGDIVDVQGVSKGKGFAGVIKRHNFHRGPMSHGSHHHRAPGSIGAMFPQHVFKGKKLPGRMGAEKVTIKNLEVIRIIPEENLILIKGAIPGPKKGVVLIKESVRNSKKNTKEKA